jgi:hypothetical protein
VSEGKNPFRPPGFFLKHTQKQKPAHEGQKLWIFSNPVMDRFGLYLALYKTRLARHSVMQYFRQANMWLLDRYPRLAPLVDKALLKKGRFLEGFCAKRWEDGQASERVQEGCVAKWTEENGLEGSAPPRRTGPR